MMKEKYYVWEIDENIENKLEWIQEFIANGQFQELKSFITQLGIKSEDFNNFNDILLDSIESYSISPDIIKFILDQRRDKNLNINIIKNEQTKNFLFSAVEFNEFEIATILIEQGANINYLMNGENIIVKLLNQADLNYQNLTYILENGFNIKYINKDLINNLIENETDDFLEIILNHFKFNNKFILKLLSFYKNKNPITTKQLKHYIHSEKEKIIIDEDMYKNAVQKNNNNLLRILFENDSSHNPKLLNRIIKYNLLEKAILSNDYSFVKNILRNEIFTNKRMNYSQLIKESIDNNNLEITKLLIKTFVNHSCNNNIKSKNDKSIIKMKNQNSTQYINLILNLIIKLNNLTLVKYIIENDDFKLDIDINTKDINGEYPIIKAFYAENNEIFKYLIEHGANVNTKNNNGVSLMLLAIHNNKPEILRYLMKHHVDINETDINGNSPLLKAVNQNSTEIVELLIDYGDENDLEININEEIDNKDYALFKAIQQNNFDIVFALVNYGVNHHKDMNIHDIYGNTPLIQSYNLGYIEIFKYLAKYLNINQKDSYGNTILFYAIKKEDLETIKELINIGIDVNTTNNSNTSILDYAISKGNSEIVEILLEKNNLNINVPNSEGDVPIFSLIKSDQYDENTKKQIINKFIEKGCNINKVDKQKNSVLIYAVKYKYPSIVDLLLNNGINVDMENEDEENAIEIALQIDDDQVINCFINFKYDVYNVEYFRYNFNAIRNLIEKEDLNTLEKLISNEIDINMQNEENGNTLLMEAVILRKPDIVEYLINNGADKNIKNDDGYTAISFNYNNNNRYDNRYYNTHSKINRLLKNNFY